MIYLFIYMYFYIVTNSCTVVSCVMETITRSANNYKLDTTSELHVISI